MSEKLHLSAESFKYWALDYDRNEYVVVTSNGERYVRSMPFASRSSNEIAVSVFDWEKWWVISTTKRGDTIFSEAYSPAATDKGRPSVYLDQNHWSTLAWAMFEPKRIDNSDERNAAERIAELARDAGIVVPLSSAHFTETLPLYGSRRYNLGLAMAQLAGGWELRSPLSVWDNEVAAMLARRSDVSPPPFCDLPVVTTEPRAMLADGTHAYEARDDWELFQMVLAEPAVTLSMLIDTTSQPKVAIPDWVKRNQELTTYFAESALSNEQRRRQATGFFWTDNIQVLVRAATRVGVDANSFAQNAAEIMEQTESMPFVSNFSGLSTLRYLDRTTRWKTNDLTDMIYLSCAAAYCDYVAAERHTGGQLRAIQTRRGQTPNTYMSLADLVDALSATGVQTATERSRRTAVE